jgi:hypothetical protein
MPRVEWAVPVAVAVGKLLLRASGQVDAADAIGDAQEGWARLRQLRTDGRGDAIGRVISGQLEQRLVGVTDQGQAQDLRATAEDVASLIGGLANDNEAVRVAAAHPDQFLAYAKQHGDQLRRSSSTAATPLFDRILEAAAAESVELAPSSRRFMSAGLAEVLRLAETLPDIHEYSRRAACRWVMPEEAGSAATPHSMAKAGSLRIRAGLSPKVTSSGPTTCKARPTDEFSTVALLSARPRR